MKHIIHVDMDAFYASVEQRDQPAFRGRPVIVGADPKNGHGRGVVAACSYEARQFNVHSALPISVAWRRCPDGVYLRPRMSVYRTVSGQIMDIFRHYTELVEPISLDEAFLDVTGSTRLLGPVEHIARRIKDEVRNQTGLTASVGVAPSKFVAKIASDLEKPDGFVVVEKEQVRDFLFPLPIRKLPGVGPRLGQKLLDMGLQTVGQLGQLSPQEVVRLGKSGEHLRALANGVDDRPVVPEREPKSISNETTFDQDLDDVEHLKLTLRKLSDKVARRLRQAHYRATTVTLKLRFSSFETHTRQASAQDPLNSSNAIFQLAEQLFSRFELSQRVRLLGIGVTGLKKDAPDDQRQLFSETAKTEELDRVLDSVQERYGDRAIRRASELD